MTLLARLPVVLVVALVVHTAVLPHLRVLGVAADVLLVVAVAAGTAAGPERGALVGFVVGLLADCLLTTPFGLSALTWTVIGFGVGSLQGTILRASPWTPLLIGAAASGLGVVLFALLGAVLGEDGLVTGRLVTVAAVVAVWGGLLLPAVLPPVRWVTREGDASGLVLR